MKKPIGHGMATEIPRRFLADTVKLPGLVWRKTMPDTAHFMEDDFPWNRQEFFLAAFTTWCIFPP